MAYCVFRFRHQEGGEAAYEPENKRLEWWLTVVTAVGRRGHAGAGPVRLAPFRHGSGRMRPRSRSWASNGNGAFASRQGRRARHLATRDNSHRRQSVRPQSERSASARTTSLIEADDLHLPIGKPVKVLLRSIDVLHDFYVPEFRAKMDMVPGMITYFWFTPTRTGTFDVLCAELCGFGPLHMRGTVVVEDESAYQAWLREQQTFAQLSADASNGDGERRPSDETARRG